VDAGRAHAYAQTNAAMHKPTRPAAEMRLRFTNFDWIRVKGPYHVYAGHNKMSLYVSRFVCFVFMFIYFLVPENGHWSPVFD
jgi:hypothetical protein